MPVMASFTYVDHAAATKTMLMKGPVAGIAAWRNVTDVSSEAGQPSCKFSVKLAGKDSDFYRYVVVIDYPRLDSDGNILYVNQISATIKLHKLSSLDDIKDALRISAYAFSDAETGSPAQAMMGREFVW